MSESDVQRCEVADAPRCWPELHVLVVTHPRSVDLAIGREAARRRVRALLLRHAGPEIAASLVAAARAAPGACRASISHDSSRSVLAWCEHGCIGIDIVGAHRLVDSAVPALAIAAALYLGPDTAAVISSTTDAAQARTLFADAWARHEASLKCLGLALDEWSPALQVKLATCSTAVVSTPSEDIAGPAEWVTRIAWRNRSSCRVE
jgi:4'-phosphopantetheinyl transferase